MPALVHLVCFTLHDDSPSKVQELVGACKKYLDGHTGVKYFTVGTLNPNLTRPVNDRAYSVSLHIEFVDQAAHDAYQVHSRHLEFIEKGKPNWKQVRVFDSDVV